MNVCHIVTSLETGGMEKVVCSLLAYPATSPFALRDEGGVQGFLFCTDAEGELYKEAVAQAKAVGNRQRMKWVVDWRVVGSLIRFIRAERIGCLQAHNHVAHLYAVLAWLCTGVPVVVTLHGQGIHDSWRTIRLRLLLAKVTKAVVVVSQDAGDVVVRSGAVPRRKVVVIPNGIDARRFAPREAMDDRDQTSVLRPQTSDKTTKDIKDKGANILESNAQGIEANVSSSLRAKLGIPADTVVIGSVGRLSPEKNYPLLVRAFARLVRGEVVDHGCLSADIRPRISGRREEGARGERNQEYVHERRKGLEVKEGMATSISPEGAKSLSPAVLSTVVLAKEELLSVGKNAGLGAKVFLLLVGDGPDRGRIEEEMRRQDVADRCHVAGIQADVLPWLHAMDIFCLSSETEGLSISLLEAGACGLPIVVTDVGGNREIVLDGESGWLVKKGDERALACALERLRNDAALRCQMGAAARRRVVQQFSMDAMGEKYMELYSSVLRGRNRMG